MGFVLELQQPFLRAAVDVDVDIDAARVVLLALLKVVEQPLLLQVARAYRGELHEAEPPVVAAEFVADAPELREFGLELTAQEGVVHADLLKFGGEGGVAAVVAPVGVKYAQFCLGGVAPLAAEIFHDLPEVVGVHRQSPAAAEVRILAGLHLREAVERRQRLHVDLVVGAQDAEVLGPGLHGVDVVMADLRELLFAEVVVEYQQPGAAYLHVGGGVDKMHAVDRRGRPLVELAGDVLHREVFLPFERALVGHCVGDGLPEDRVSALLQQFVAEAEEVVDIEQAQAAQRQ